MKTSVCCLWWYCHKRFNSKPPGFRRNKFDISKFGEEMLLQLRQRRRC